MNAGKESGARDAGALPPPDVECPHCGELLDVAYGGWPFRYTQVLLHLDRCMEDATEHQRQAAARLLIGTP